MTSRQAPSPRLRTHEKPPHPDPLVDRVCPSPTISASARPFRSSRCSCSAGGPERTPACLCCRLRSAATGRPMWGRNGSRQTCASSWPYGSEHAPGELPRIVGTVITDLPGRRRRCARKQGALYQGAVAGSRRELETVVDGIKRSGLVHPLARGDRGESALSMTFTTSRSMGFQWSRDT
jgi:hypothetical protein